MLIEAINEYGLTDWYKPEQDVIYDLLYVLSYSKNDNTIFNKNKGWLDSIVKKIDFKRVD